MSIVPLKKITLCGVLKEKKQVLQQMQLTGGAHLIPLTAEENLKPGMSQQQTEKAHQALKYLTQCANKRHQVQEDDSFNARDIVQQVLQVQADVISLSEQREFLQQRIDNMMPWGSFEFADLGPLMLWFYIVPKRLMKKVDDALTWQVVASDNIHCYVVVLAEQELETSLMPVPRTHTGSLPLAQLQKELQMLELKLDDLQAERESLTRWTSLLSLSLVNVAEHDALKFARQMALDIDEVFVIQAWVPERLITDYHQFADTHHLAMLVSDTQVADRPPTLLENNDNIAGGEQLISFYQTPAYQDWDPTPMVFFSFALFFAMILSDAGYAAVFALLLLIKWRSLSTSLKRRRLRSLLSMTLFSSILWGVLCGSYFGASPSVDSWPASLKIVDLNDFDSMMQLSISVGAVHLSVANLIKAWQWRRQWTALACLGWCLAVAGGYLMWWGEGEQNAVIKDTALAMLIVAASAVVLFSSRQAVHKPADVVARLWDGIQQLTTATRLFGDVLSYMRLFALGLASASLAMTFNQLAVQVGQTVPGAGLLLSLLILLFGHSLNLMLCLMSGVVHGLRLNFIEFYNWSVSDEGYPFKEFAKKGAG